MFSWFKKKPVELVSEIEPPSYLTPSYGYEVKVFSVLSETCCGASKLPRVPIVGETISVSYECYSVGFTQDGPGVFTAIAKYRKAAATLSEPRKENDDQDPS